MGNPILEVTENTRETREEKGREHLILSCSMCSAELVDLWLADPNEQLVVKGKPKGILKWKVKATCCFCGDQSYTKEVTGGFKHHGIIRQTSEDVDDYVDVTKVIDIAREDNVIVFKTEKGEVNE